MTSTAPYAHLFWRYFLLKCIFFYCNIVLVSFAGELRFCYNGPQRIRYKDCPGGFVTYELVESSCIYYHKMEGNPDLDTWISEDICDEDASGRDLETDYDDLAAKGVRNFRILKWNNSSNEGTTEEGDPAYDKCNASCLDHYIEPKYWGAAQVFVDKDDLVEPTKEQYEKLYVEKTKEILMKLINEDEIEAETEIPGDKDRATDNSLLSIAGLDILKDNVTIMNTPMTSLMKLLAKSMRITYKGCKPFLEKSFYSLVFRTMIEWRRSNDDFPDINIVPLRRIMALLDKCEAGMGTSESQARSDLSPSITMGGSDCKDKHVVTTFKSVRTNLTKVHKLDPVSFRWGRYDPIIDAAWSAVVFVHGNCQDYLLDDMLHFSLYVRGMTSIFEQPHMERHWMYPYPVGKGLALWEMAYNTPDIQGQMNALDACIQAAYTGGVFESRLDRTFVKQDFVENPVYVNDSNMPEMGWNETVEEYWKMYDQKGFKEVSAKLGYCAPSTKDVDEYTTRYRAKSCHHAESKNTQTDSQGDKRDYEYQSLSHWDDDDYDYQYG